MIDMDEQIEVTVSHGKGDEGTGWYVWEAEYPEEVYVYFSPSHPSADDLKKICENYVEEKS